MRRFACFAFRSLAEMTVLGVTIVCLLALVSAGFAHCAPEARAAVPPADAQVEALSNILGAELQDGVSLYRAQFRGEVCYVVVAEMGGMAAGHQAAVDCL